MTAPDPAAVETVARAIFEASNPIVKTVPDYWERAQGLRDDYRRLAAAALAAMPVSRSEAAVARVEALADELLSDAESAITPGYYRDAADRIRAALASPAPAPQGEEGQR